MQKRMKRADKLITEKAFWFDHIAASMGCTSVTYGKNSVVVNHQVVLKKFNRLLQLKKGI